MNRCIASGLLRGQGKNLFALIMAWAAAMASVCAQDLQSSVDAAQGGTVMYEQSALPQIGVRPFPKDAKRATMRMQLPPEVLINGKLERLSVGHRIRSATNMQVMSGEIVGQALQVNYRRNANGEIHEVWILSRREALDQRESLREGNGPTRNFSFDANTDKAVRDDGKTPFDKLPKYKY